MKHLKLCLLAIVFFSTFSFSQNQEDISSLDFVQILNGNVEEAFFYYENNWKQLRIKAIEKGYIKSFKLLKVTETNAEFDIILETTYEDKAQFEQREPRFQELIKASGGLKLLNDKTPETFRKTLYWSDATLKHK